MQKKRRDKRVTLKDLAIITGYTINTVSRALHNKPDISLETKVKIQQAARQAGYIPNWIASSLRTGSSNTIAVIVCDLSNPFFALMVADIEAAASEFGYSVIVLCTHESQEKEENAIRVALGRQVDGILLCPCQESENSLSLLDESNLPYVLLSRHFPKHNADALVCDETRGGFLATEHLILAGHKKLIFLSSFDHVSSIAQRRNGFITAAKKYEISESDRLVYNHEFGEKTAAYLKEKLNLGFSGVFAYCDMEAWKVITCIEKLGIRIPEDMAFIGYDNIQGKLGFHFSLCSIESSLQNICKGSVYLLNEKIKGSTLQRGLTIYPVSLVCRGSCRKHL